MAALLAPTAVGRLPKDPRFPAAVQLSFITRPGEGSLNNNLEVPRGERLLQDRSQRFSINREGSCPVHPVRQTIRGNLEWN
jgi:hypothetical protein